MRTRGAGGDGSDVESFNKQINESEGRLGSMFDAKRARGSLPVEEKRETMLDCTADKNMVDATYRTSVVKGLHYKKTKSAQWRRQRLYGRSHSRLTTFSQIHIVLSFTSTNTEGMEKQK